MAKGIVATALLVTLLDKFKTDRLATSSGIDRPRRASAGPNDGRIGSWLPHDATDVVATKFAVVWLLTRRQGGLVAHTLAV